jgi:hypothetical protein
MYSLRQIYNGHGNCFGHTRLYSWVTYVKWKLVLVHLEIELVLVQDRCMVCVEHTIVLKSFWLHPMVLLGDVGQVEARFGLFGDSVILSTR